MPKLSLNTLIQRAIEPACRDRESLADAYNHEGEWAEQALALVADMKALRGKHVKDMSDAQLRTAYAALLNAEQWEQSFADSNPGPQFEREARRAAKLYRDARIITWGPTALETDMANATSVDIRELPELMRQRAAAGPASES